MAKLNAALADAHLTKISTEKCGDKEQVNYLQRESFGERPRMLVIDKDAAQRYLEN